MRFLALAFLLASSVVSARTWTAKDGRTLEAEMMSADQHSVSVLTADGRLYDIPYSSLVAEDKDYALFTSPPESLPVLSVLDAVCTIKVGPSRGTGFLAQDGGLLYLYTNQHVISGAKREAIEVQSSDGGTVVLGTLEIDPGADVARIRVLGDSGLVFAQSAGINDPVFCYGNSGGADVVTQNEGQVLGLGAEKVEVSSAIVPGNSGGPIVNDNEEVVAVASYIRRNSPFDNEESDGEAQEGDEQQAEQEGEEDWRFAGTRYNKVRRFGVNLMNERSWTRVDWNQYADASKTFEENEALVFAWAEATATILRDPFIMLPNDRELDSHIIQNLIDVQNTRSRKRNEILGDSVSRDRLSSLNRTIREEFTRQVIDSSDQVLRELQKYKSNPKYKHFTFLQERNDQITELATEWRSALLKAGQKLTALRHGR